MVTKLKATNAPRDLKSQAFLPCECGGHAGRSVQPTPHIARTSGEGRDRETPGNNEPNPAISASPQARFRCSCACQRGPVALVRDRRASSPNGLNEVPGLARVSSGEH